MVSNIVVGLLANGYDQSASVTHRTSGKLFFFEENAKFIQRRMITRALINADKLILMLLIFTAKLNHLKGVLKN